MSDSKTFPRDVFLYLLSIITLVTVAVAFGILLYQYVDLQYPDLLTDGYYWSKTSTLSSVRNSMAVLIVVFPVFIWVSWFLRKDIAKHSEKRDLKIRRWLLYLTLFVAALVIIGDEVAHTPEFTARSSELGEAIDWKFEAKKIFDMGINIYSIQCLDNGDKLTRLFYKEIALKVLVPKYFALTSWVAEKVSLHI